MVVACRNQYRHNTMKKIIQNHNTIFFYMELATLMSIERHLIIGSLVQKW
jgi:hypothetical protein